MPAMGDSVAEGTVLEWHKQEGDTVDADETLVEISTDKVDAEVPSPAAGTIVKIHAAEGDTVAVGALLAEISTNGGGRHRRPRRCRRSRRPPPLRRRLRERPPRPRALPRPRRASARRSTSSPPPAGSRSPRARSWSGRSRSATSVKQGDTVVEISTDKVDMELPAPATGQIVEILAQDGETVSVGQVIARMTAGAEAAAAQPTTPAAARAAGLDRRRARPAAPLPPMRRQRLTGRPACRRPAGNRSGDRPRQRARRPDHQGRRARRGRGNGAPAAQRPRRTAPKPGGATLIKGGAAALARYMDESRSIPTATSFRTLTVTELEQRRQAAQAGRPPRLLHPPDRLRDRARGDRGACR